MPTTEGILGKGTLFQRSTDGTTYTTVAEVRDISLDFPESDRVDFTHMTSPNSFRESKASWKGEATCTIDISYVPTNSTHQDLVSDWKNGTERYWKVIFTDDVNSELTFDGYVSSFPIELPFEDRVSSNFTIFVTAEPTFPGE